MAIQVQTTHNVIIDYETANLGKRIAAFLIDWIILGSWLLACYYLLFQHFMIDAYSFYTDDFSWVLNFIAFFFVFLYDLVFEYLNYGRTPGKLIMRIRVVRLDGAVPSFNQYMIRWLFRPIDFGLAQGFVALIMVAVSKNSQRLGDYLAGTTVIDLRVQKSKRELTARELDFNEDYELKHTSVLQYLSDRDIETIMTVLNSDKKAHDDAFKQRLTERIQEITGYTIDRKYQTDEDFLQKIVDDYHYMAVK